MPTGLVKRATHRLARHTATGGRRTEYLCFALSGEKYAVQIAHVAEILKPPPVTEVPRAPRTVLGVISVRGKLVTVIDLRRRFKLPEAPFDRRTRILLADVGTDEQVGLLVDEVQQVYRLADNEIEPANVLGGEQAAHIAGIGRPKPADGGRRDESELLILLDLRPILES
jgi:purine-binding chemotaxis protein CheW